MENISGTEMINMRQLLSILAEQSGTISIIASWEAFESRSLNAALG